MKLIPLTHLGFLVNWIIDERPANDLSFHEIHDAARAGDLIGLLIRRFGHVADFSLLQSDPSLLEQMEAALCDAASPFEGREAGKACVENSGLCLVMAIVLEAIQQQCNPSRACQPAPEDA